MNNIKIKLKWKLTLFTILIMTITSGILVFSINYDVRHTVPQLKGVINSNTGDVKIDLNSDFKAEIDNISIESAIEETTSRIYWLSITTFILVVIIGGMCTYFVHILAWDEKYEEIINDSKIRKCFYIPKEI